MNLYLVTCRGMNILGLGANVAHGKAYVVAENPDEAYKKVRAYLDNKDLGFHSERELLKIELLADVGDYPKSGFHLFL